MTDLQDLYQELILDHAVLARFHKLALQLEGFTVIHPAELPETAVTH